MTLDHKSSLKSLGYIQYVFFFVTQRRRSHFFPPRPLPYFPCLLSCLVTSHLLRDSLCIALQTEKLWIWSTGLSTQLTPSSRREAWVLGNPTALTEHLRLATRWTRGKGGVSCVSGSFRGGHWRYLPIRNHDNRSFADRIRLCPGLSKNSENGNSCPKPHKAAHHDWSSGRAVSIETETINRNMDSIMEKLTALHRRPEWTKRVAVELECGYSPQGLNNRNLIFRLPRTSTGLGQGRCWKINPEKSTAGRRSCVPPPILKTAADYTYTHIHTKTITNTYTHLPTPDPSPPSLWTASLTSGSVTSAGKWLHVWMADCRSWITSPVAKSCVYGVLCAFVAEVFFLFSHCTPQGA